MTQTTPPTNAATKAAASPLLSWRTLSALADRRLLVFAGGLLVYGVVGGARHGDDGVVLGVVQYGGAAVVIVVLHVVGAAWLTARRALLAKACADAAAALPAGDAKRELDETRALVVAEPRGKVLAQLEARLHYLQDVVAREGPTAKIDLDERSLRGLPEH